MNFDELVKYIKEQGCRVIIYKDRGSLNKDRCVGYFERKKKGPFICIATADLDKPSCVELLMHEFSHFLQWKDGTETRKTDLAYKTWDRWLNGKNVKPARLEEIRKIILIHEWDAEMRSIALNQSLQVKSYRIRSVIRGANAYMATIKWCFQTRCTSSWTPERSKFPVKILSKEELLTPLDKKQLDRIEKLLAIQTIPVAN